MRIKCGSLCTTHRPLMFDVLNLFYIVLEPNYFPYAINSQFCNVYFNKANSNNKNGCSCNPKVFKLIK